MALGTDRRRINVKGGGILQVREIDPTPNDNFSSLGFIKSDTFLDEHSMVESIDSKGDQIDNKSGGHAVTWTSVLMQTSKDEIDLMADAEAKYYEVYYRVQLNNGDYQMIVFPVCRIKPGFSLEFQSATERTIELEIRALAPAIALAARTPSAEYDTAVWEAYSLVESSASIAAPTDSASVPQQAI
jgi:hypothetical protein